MDINLFWVGAGLAALGYFIGEGLKNFNNPKSNYRGYPALIKEKDLPYYLNLNNKEVEDLVAKYPDIPKVELNGATYYPLMEWLSSGEMFHNRSTK